MNEMIAQLKNWIRGHGAFLLPISIFCISGIVNAVVMYFDNVICNDAVYYRKMIDNWIKYDDIMMMHANSWNSIAMPPFWLWCVKNVSTRFDVDIFAAARGINFIAGSLTPLVFYYIVRTFNKSIYFAFFCAMVLSCHPVVSSLTATISRDCLYFFLISLVVLLFFKGMMKSKMYLAVLAGIPLGLAILTRYESIEIMPCCAIFIIFCVWDKILTWQRAVVLYLSLCITLFSVFSASSLFMKLSSEYHMLFWGRYLDRITDFF